MLFSSNLTDYVLTRTVNLWRKAPGAPTTCSDALKAYASLDTADAIIHLRSDPKGLTYEEAARRLKIVSDSGSLKFYPRFLP